MRVAVDRVGQALDADGKPDTYESHGSRGYFFEGHVLDSMPAQKIKEGEYLRFKGNFKNPPEVGTTEDFELRLKGNGDKTSFRDNEGQWRVVVGRPSQRDNSRAGNPYNGPQNAARAPQSHANGAGAAQVAAARPTAPTMSQAVAVLRECVAAVEGWGSDAHATTLFLGRLRGDIRRDPSPAEIQAQADAAQAAADAEAAEAQRLAAEAAERAKAAAQRIPQAPAGYAPPAMGSDDIPF